jgi:hypothetical protein
MNIANHMAQRSANGMVADVKLGMQLLRSERAADGQNLARGPTVMFE